MFCLSPSCMDLLSPCVPIAKMCVPGVCQKGFMMGNSIKITKRTVDALKPTGKRFTLMDAQLKGFCVRVSAAGTKVYGYRYRVGGGRSGRGRWLSIGSHGTITPDQARNIAQGWASEVAAGGDPASDRDAKRIAPTVSELLDRYLSDHVDRKNKASTAKNARNQVSRYIRPMLGNLKVADVTRADISKFHSSLASTPYAANRALALLSKAFGLSEVWGLRPDHTNPCTRVERFEEKPRERFLSDQEFATLGEVLAQAETSPLHVHGRSRPIAINPQAISAIRLLIFTGARVSEILGLRWEWINFDSQLAELPDSKTGKKQLYLPPAAFEILRDLNCPPNGMGFVIRGGAGDNPEVPLVNIKDPWAYIRNAADLEGVRLHDLRHSFASTAVAGGMSLPMIGALLGHADVKTTARYAHLSDDPLRDAAAQIGGKISDAMLGGKGGAEIVPIRKKQ